jgi:hypothetical protein
MERVVVIYADADVLEQCREIHARIQSIVNTQCEIHHGREHCPGADCGRALVDHNHHRSKTMESGGEMFIVIAFVGANRRLLPLRAFQSLHQVLDLDLFCQRDDPVLNIVSRLSST